MKSFGNKWTVFGIASSLIFVLLIGIIYVWKPAPGPGFPDTGPAAVVKLPFTYRFHVDGRLEEASSAESGSSPYWWLNSGGLMDLKTGIGLTNHGELPMGSRWRRLYAANNPVDTDNGYHPQNIFRLLSRTMWQDVAHEASFRIDANQLSASPNRNSSNGLLQMVRYADQHNLYYAGLRVDGNAVIKKKKAGTYYTMAYKPVITGKRYDRQLEPNLLPIGTWIRMKTITKNLDATRVSIKFYVDIGMTGTYTLAAEVIDDGKTFGGAALTQAGHSGLRTDFMDVSFDDWTLTVAN